MIKLVIFDIGGVLINFTEEDYVHYLREKDLPDIDEEELTDFILRLVPLMEYGTLGVPELERMVAKHFNKKKLNLRWVEGFKRLATPNKRGIKIFNNVGEKYRTALLSNVSFSRYEEMKETFLPLIKTERVFTSCEMRMRKPQPGIYERVVQEMGAKPSESLFVDNQIENVIGAEKEGMKAIWYRSNDELEEELRKLNIL